MPLHHRCSIKPPQDIAILSVPRGRERGSRFPLPHQHRLDSISQHKKDSERPHDYLLPKLPSEISSERKSTRTLPLSPPIEPTLCRNSTQASQYILFLSQCQLWVLRISEAHASACRLHIFPHGMLVEHCFITNCCADGLSTVDNDPALTFHSIKLRTPL